MASVRVFKNMLVSCTMGKAKSHLFVIKPFFKFLPVGCIVKLAVLTQS